MAMISRASSAAIGAPAAISPMRGICTICSCGIYTDAARLIIVFLKITQCLKAFSHDDAPWRPRKA